jgi:hypothetical protein
MLKGEATAASKRVPIKLRNSATGAYTTGLALTGSEIQVSVNGAAFANATGTVVEVGSGAYYYEAATAALGKPPTARTQPVRLPTAAF